MSPHVTLAFRGKDAEYARMIPRVAIPRATCLIAVLSVLCRLSNAQDAAAEMKLLRQTVEHQARQIELLTAQVARLTAKIEGGAAAAPTAQPPGAESAEFAIPAARPVASQPPANVHIVVKGESLEKIAKAHGTNSAELQKLNRITDPKKLQIGQQLLLPASTPK